MSLACLTSPEKYLKYHFIDCPDGGIGRRTRFRSWRQQWCGGSSPLLGTNSSDWFSTGLNLKDPAPVPAAAGFFSSQLSVHGQHSVHQDSLQKSASTLGPGSEQARRHHGSSMSPERCAFRVTGPIRSHTYGRLCAHGKYDWRVQCSFVPALARIPHGRAMDGYRPHAHRTAHATGCLDENDRSEMTGRDLLQCRDGETIRKDGVP